MSTAEDILQGTAFATVAADAHARGGFCHDMTHHVAAYLPDGHKRLVVTFDNLASGREKVARYPWGHSFLAENGWDVLGIMAKRPDWFRHADVWDLFDTLKAEGFFTAYDHVAFYGASMGAYAALAFAPAAPGCTVMAFAPQSSLDIALVPFEQRFPVLGDWTGRYADAAEGVRAAGRAYVVFDPLLKADAAHAQRLVGPHVMLLPLWGTEHKVPPSLQRMGILKALALGGLEGTLNMPQVRRLYRARHSSLPWITILLEMAAKRKHARLASRVADNLWKSNRHWKFGKLAKKLRTMHAASDTSADQ